MKFSGVHKYTLNQFRTSTDSKISKAGPKRPKDPNISAKTKFVKEGNIESC